MPTNLANIPAQQQDFYTSRNAAWLDGYPVIGTPANGGVVAGLTNVGNGSFVLKGVDSGTQYGVHVATITAITAGLTYVTVTNPDGIVTGQGVVGVPFYAGGLTLEIDPGAKAYVVNDVFAVSIAPQPLDITGLRFQLLAYRPPSASSLWLTGDTLPDASTGSLINGGFAGTLANRFHKSTMGGLEVGSFPYNVLAVDPTLPNDPVVAFYGTINHDVLIRNVNS